MAPFKYGILTVLFSMFVVSSYNAAHACVQTDDIYCTCVTAMRSTPMEAEKPCRAYLASAHAEDQDQIQCVKAWLTRFDQMKPYIHFLPSLANPNAAWFVYQPDMLIELPQTSKTGNRFEMEISRSFADKKEDVLLKIAEAVYPGSGPMIQSAITSPLCVQDITEDKVPVWGRCGNDNIEMADIVTARAVRYYYDLTMLARKNPKLPSGFRAESTVMTYSGEIKRFENYSHGKDKFQSVYVADLTLKWGFTCGGLCGVGFTRNKVVVLDGQGKVLAMYLDAPVNSEFWVS